MIEQLIQFGALGLCGYMVLMNYRDRDRMLKVLDKRDEYIREEIEARAQLMDKLTTAMNRISETLEDRPCILGDSRINQPKIGE